MRGHLFSVQSVGLDCLKGPFGVDIFRTLDWWMFEVSNYHGLPAQMKRGEGEIQVQPFRFRGTQMDINSLNRHTVFSINQ